MSCGCGEDMHMQPHSPSFSFMWTKKNFTVKTEPLTCPQYNAIIIYSYFFYYLHFCHLFSGDGQGPFSSIILLTISHDPESIGSCRACCPGNISTNSNQFIFYMFSQWNKITLRICKEFDQEVHLTMYMVCLCEQSIKMCVNNTKGVAYWKNM